MSLSLQVLTMMVQEFLTHGASVAGTRLSCRAPLFLRRDEVEALINQERWAPFISGCFADGTAHPSRCVKDARRERGGADGV